MNRSQIEREVVETLGRVVPDTHTVELDGARLLRDQIEIDSMDLLSFVLAVETRFSIEVPPTSYPMFASVDHAVECVAEILAHRRDPQSPGATISPTE